MVSIKNEAALLCVPMRERARSSMSSFPLKSSVFVVNFSNKFWHGNKAFPNVVLRMKLCCYQIKIFRSCRARVVHVALVSHSCRSCRTRVSLVPTDVAHVSLVLHLCCAWRTRVAFVSLVSGACIVNKTRSKVFNEIPRRQQRKINSFMTELPII